MKVLNNNGVIDAFLNHKPARNSTESLYTSDDATRLYSYQTCVAEWHEGKLYVNTHRFSVTTSKHTYRLRGMINDRTIIGVSWSLRDAWCLYDKCYEQTLSYKRQEKYRVFIKEVEEFRNTDLVYSNLSPKTREFIDKGLKECRPCKYLTFKSKFQKLIDNTSRNFPIFKEFKKRVQHRQPSPIQAFAFMV